MGTLEFHLQANLCAQLHGICFHGENLQLENLCGTTGVTDNSKLEPNTEDKVNCLQTTTATFFLVDILHSTRFI